MGRSKPPPTPREILQFAKWYVPIAAVFCGAAALVMKHGNSWWEGVGTIVLILSLLPGFISLLLLYFTGMVTVFAATMSLAVSVVFKFLAWLFHLILPEDRKSDFDISSDFATGHPPAKVLTVYATVVLLLAAVVAACQFLLHDQNDRLKDTSTIIAVLALFPLIGAVMAVTLLGGLFGLVQAIWLHGRIAAWLMRKLVPGSAPDGGLCGAGLFFMLLFGWISLTAEFSPDQWPGKAILLAISFGGFLMLAWPLADLEKSSLVALVFAATGSTALGVIASRISPAAVLYFAFACFLWLESFRKLRSDPAPKSAMTVRIAASAVLGAALEGGILFYAAHTAPREPEALAPPDPEKTLVER